MDSFETQERKTIVDTPEQEKNQWIESVEREWKTHKNHEASVTERQRIEDISKFGANTMSYFNNNKKHQPVSVYDRRFHIKHGYSQKLRRDDLMHTLGLNVQAEEEDKKVPILSSSVYGRRPPIDPPFVQHNRAEVIRQEFYRNGGTNISTGQ
eukprot:gene19140-21057_t